MDRSLLVIALAALALGSAACPGGDDYMQVPGGGGPPGQGVSIDARLADASNDGMVRTRICVVTDLRQPESCSPNNNVGVIVREVGSTAQATTTAGGVFDLAVTATDVAILEVGAGSTTLVPSIVAVDVAAQPDSVPVPSAAEYQALVAALAPSVPDGSGTIASYFFNPASRAFAGVEVQLPEGALNPAWYDVAGTRSPPWVLDVGTGPYGATLLFGIPEGAASFAALGPNGEDLSLSNIAVTAGHVTFVTQQVTDTTP